MASKPQSTQVFNIAAVLQGGRLGYEALLLTASLRVTNPGFAGRLLLMEPQPGPRWTGSPALDNPALRTRLEDLGAEILPFESRVFGSAYPYGNKIAVSYTHLTLPTSDLV